MVIYVETNDERMKCAAKALEGCGYEVKSYSGAADEPITLVVSPAKPPEKLFELIETLKSGSTLIGGQSRADVSERAAEHGIRYINAVTDEAFAVKNAVATAEGALSLIIKNTKKVMAETVIAVTGFGRIGRLLAQMLHQLGARVHIFARNPVDIAYAYKYRIRSYSELETAIGGFDAVINTVPSRVIDNAVLDKAAPGLFLLELASSPYGFDAEYAAERGINVLRAPGLPTHYAPESAGRYLAESVKTKLEVENA